MNVSAAIHIAKKQLGLDDDTYRDLLARVTGKRSAGDMSDAERRAVLDEMRRHGFKTNSNGARKPLEGRFAGKLQALWIAGWNLGVVDDRDDAALLMFVKRQTNIDHVRFLRHPEDADKAIEALKGWLARAAGVDWSQGNHLPQWLRAPGAKIAMAQWNRLHKDLAPAASFGAFRAFVAENARTSLDATTKEGWRLVMNALGEQIRAVRS